MSLRISAGDYEIIFLRSKRVASFFQYSFDSDGKLTYQRQVEEISKEDALDGLFII
jgi:hypothetical protein